MNDHILKAESAAALWAALIAAGIVREELDPEGQTQRVIMAGYSLCVIGTICRSTGEIVTVDGETVEVTAPIDGYHANLYGPLTDEQREILPLIPMPTKREVVWLAI
jgi:hypothetical protein